MSIVPENGLPVLSCGKHSDPRDGACLMEYVSVLAGEKFSDHPRCTGRLLAHLARMVNDATSGAGRPTLAVLAAEMVGTGGAQPDADEAVLETCYTVARRHGSVIRPHQGRMGWLRRNRTARRLDAERVVRSLRRIVPTDRRDAALYGLLSEAVATSKFAAETSALTREGDLGLQTRHASGDQGDERR